MEIKTIKTIKEETSIKIPSFIVSWSKQATKAIAKDLGIEAKSPVRVEIDSVTEEISYHVWGSEKKNAVYLTKGCKSGRPYAAFIQYDEQLDMICLVKGYARVRAKEKEPRFKELHRCYIDRNKNIWVPTRETIWDWTVQKYVPVGSGLELRNAKTVPFSMSENLVFNLLTPEKTMEVATKFFPKVVPIGGNKTVVLDTLVGFVKYVNHKSRTTKRSGPKQRLIDELTSSNFIGNEPNIKDGMHSVVQKVDYKGSEPCCCVRSFNGDYEAYRVYVIGRKVEACNRTDTGEWVQRPFTANIAADNWVCPLEVLDNEVAKGTMLEYICALISELDENVRGVAIWAFLTRPWLEKLAKALNNRVILLNAMFKNATAVKPEIWVNSIFGKNVDFDAKNIYKMLGVNKYQFAKLDEELTTMLLRPWYDRVETNSTCVALKDIFGETTNAIDNSTTDAVMAFSTKFNKDLIFLYYGEKRAAFNILKQIKDAKGVNAMISAMDYAMSLKNQKVALSIRTEHSCYIPRISALNALNDYISMSVTLGMNFITKFENLERLAEAHDMLTDIMNFKRVEIEQRKWDVRKPFWSKWTFAPEDEDYLVIAPEKPEDLATEGITLSHCVKGYINRVTNGTTNIMFIRKKSEPDTPFFTVEVSNTNRVEQIHGFGNRNLCTEPALVPFVKKWLKARKLSEKNYNKVR